MKPPRALWVPFELGRPLGTPDNPPFQRKVLAALLELFEEPSGPVLIDFPEDAPESSEELEGLACPLYFSQVQVETDGVDSLLAAFRSEITAMRPWYEMSISKRNRTTVGVSGIEPDCLADFIYAFAQGREPDNPRKDIPLVYMLKYAVEDLKSYYIEGITAQPGQEGASSRLLEDWFWDETVAGKVLLELRKICQASTDKMMNMIGSHFIVPGEVARRKEKQD
jgi:hypothetical protein